MWVWRWEAEQEQRQSPSERHWVMGKEWWEERTSVKSRDESKGLGEGAYSRRKDSFIPTDSAGWSHVPRSRGTAHLKLVLKSILRHISGNKQVVQIGLLCKEYKTLHQPITTVFGEDTLWAFLSLSTNGCVWVQEMISLGRSSLWAMLGGRITATFSRNQRTLIYIWNEREKHHHFIVSFVPINPPLTMTAK